MKNMCNIILSEKKYNAKFIPHIYNNKVIFMYEKDGQYRKMTKTASGW